MIIYMFPVLDDSRNHDRLFLSFYGVNDRAGTPVGNDHAALIHHLHIMFPIKKRLMPAILRHIITGSRLHEDLPWYNPFPDHLIYLFDQTVKLKFLGTNCHKYHLATSIDPSHIQGIWITFLHFRPLDIKPVCKMIK